MAMFYSLNYKSVRKMKKLADLKQTMISTTTYALNIFAVFQFESEHKFAFFQFS